jgi:hypothetical protein
MRLRAEEGDELAALQARFEEQGIHLAQRFRAEQRAVSMSSMRSPQSTRQSMTRNSEREPPFLRKPLHASIRYRCSPFS